MANKNPVGNKTGKGGFKDNPKNRNLAGQRNIAAVETAAQYRDELLGLLHKPFGTPIPNDATYLQKMAYEHVVSAASGNTDDREKLLDRIWGKTVQALDLTSSDGSMTPTAITFVPYVSPNTDTA